jgi:16S rRNA (cytosine1402-N4)-methyltransferase
LTDQEVLHVPVMVEEVKHYLVRPSTGLIVDMTAGTGGHGLELLKAAPEGCRLVGIDMDEEALEIAGERLKEFGDRVTLIKSNFADVLDAVPSGVAGEVDAVLMDCGISRREIVTSRRGFSFDVDGPLDMRFDNSSGRTAKSYLRSASLEELTEIFREYGEPVNARRIAKAIGARRQRGSMESTLDLAAAVKSVVRARQARSLARVFLAVRARVNREKENLSDAISSMPALLSQGGRVAVISYHSVEDRVVKTLFNRFAGKCVRPPCSEVCSTEEKKVFEVLTRKPIAPTREEVAGNPSARSAKLRVAEKM